MKWDIHVSERGSQAARTRVMEYPGTVAADRAAVVLMAARDLGVSEDRVLATRHHEAEAGKSRSQIAKEVKAALQEEDVDDLDEHIGHRGLCGLVACTAAHERDLSRAAERPSTAKRGVIGKARRPRRGPTFATLQRAYRAAVRDESAYVDDLPERATRRQLDAAWSRSEVTNKALRALQSHPDYKGSAID